MRTENKSDNRKALPKFLLWMLAGGLVGGICGATAGFLGGSAAPEKLVETIHRCLIAVFPWSQWALLAVLGGGALLQYRRAKALFVSWDGEDEATMDRAEECLSWSLLWVALDQVLSFFFVAVGFWALDQAPDYPVWAAAQFLLSFMASLAAMIVLQQKAVDLVKRMNPEKQGSVYDLKFQKKWLASCDENEQRQIGQAAMKSFTAVTITCIFSWAALVLLRIPFDIGVLPFFLVALIWGVSQVTYCLEAIRLGRHS